jgi:hypothetical protein
MSDEMAYGVPERHVEYLCAVMHSAYEDEAARVGWDTNPRSKTSWDRVPEANKQAMRAGVRAMLAVLFVPAHKSCQCDDCVLTDSPLSANDQQRAMP